MSSSDGVGIGGAPQQRWPNAGNGDDDLSRNIHTEEGQKVNSGGPSITSLWLVSCPSDDSTYTTNDDDLMVTGRAADESADESESTGQGKTRTAADELFRKREAKGWRKDPRAEEEKSCTPGDSRVQALKKGKDWTPGDSRVQSPNGTPEDREGRKVADKEDRRRHEPGKEEEKLPSAAIGGGMQHNLTKDWATLRVEVANVTSANVHRDTMLKREAHIQLNQEHCLTEAQRAGMMKDARGHGRTFIGGPTDPEQTGAHAGVDALADDLLRMYPLMSPTPHYMDAEKTGRLQIVCFDI